MEQQKSYQTMYSAEPAAAGSFASAAEIILSEDIFTLEHKLAEHVGAGCCVAVSDAASGIALALAAAGVRPGESVFCAALGCALPVQGIMLAGGIPVFLDVNPNTYTVDPYCLDYALGKLRRMGQPRPAALIATDLFGAPCGYGALLEICRREGIVLIEDLSGAFGAELEGIPAGRFGRFSVASFATPSPLEELGGGAVFCREERDAARLRTLRRGGRQEFLGEPSAPRMSSTDAFLIAARLRDCAAQLERRRRVAAAYRDFLGGHVRMQQLVRGGKSVYSQLVVALPRSRSRQRVITRLREQNIPAGAPFCGMQTGHSDWNRVMLVNALSTAERLLSLPIHPHLSPHVAEHVSGCLLRAMDSAI